MSAALAIDVGTSRLKAGVIDAGGSVLAVRTEPVASSWRDVPDQVARIVDTFAAGAWSRLGLTARMAHAVLLDDGGRALALSGPESGTEAAALDPGGDLRRRTGYGAAHPCLRLWWWRRRLEQSPLLDRVARILPWKDWLLSTLGGAPGTDPACAASLGLFDRDAQTWDGALVAHLGVPADALPALEPPDAPAGRLGCRPPGGRPVALVRGAGDGVAGSYGVSDLEEGTRYINLGTQGVYRWAVARVPPDADFAYPSGRGGYLAGTNLPGLGRRLAAAASDEASVREVLAPLAAFHRRHADRGGQRPVWLMGGGAATAGVPEVLADLLGEPVLLPAVEPTLVGAARLALGPAPPGPTAARREVRPTAP